MKRNFILLFAMMSLVLIGSCKTLKSAQKENQIDNQLKEGFVSVPLDEYITERVWRLAGCCLENGQYIFLDANMNTSRIKFLKDGKFEAASGITNYTGIWKQKTKTKQTEYFFNFQIHEKKHVDPSNTIGIPFDKAFEQNLKNTAILKLTVNEIKLYSKDGELLLNFIRL
ncbi:hypothetical protein [Treponema putidum]|uniref:hypothetical protein n=1 Tax=Treponema putidum TaxID=221027 RepID=UPI0021021380|nr:hypothetical protein [Treponema putidum]